MSIKLLKVTAAEAVVENLKERIRNGEFGPGEKLPSEQSLIKAYGVSRLTLREALARLAAWGVILVRQGKGAFVSDRISVPALDNVLIPMFPRLNTDRMNELVEARNMIESEIAAMVAENRTADQIRQLESLLIYDSREISGAEVFAERDYAFHLALAQMAGNEFMLSMYQALNRQIRFFLIQYARSVPDWEEALDRHRPILKAIKDRDSEKARSLARVHARVCASFVHEYRKKSEKPCFPPDASHGI